MVRCTPGWLAALLSFAAIPAAAQTDCPLAQQPYSSRTILVDLLIDPSAKAVLEREAPAIMKGFGPAGRIPHNFATIMSPQWLLRMRADGAATAARLDAALARVRLTPAAIRARCARYDTVPPTLPAAIARPAILVFDKITGFRDTPSVNAASAALKDMAQRRGWTLISTDNGAVFNSRDLARFDAVIWNNVSGDALTVSQQKAFKAYIRKGGGFAGFHGSAGDFVYVWDWYADALIGARFIGHPAAPQFQSARVLVAEPGKGITRDLPAEWSLNEEWYSFAASPRLTGAHVLATLDETSYSPRGQGGQNLAMGDHPIAWSRCIGRGRSFYSAIGHRPENYREANSLKLLEQGIEWAAGLGQTHCRGGREVLRR